MNTHPLIAEITQELLLEMLGKGTATYFAEHVDYDVLSYQTINLQSDGLKVHLYLYILKEGEVFRVDQDLNVIDLGSGFDKLLDDIKESVKDMWKIQNLFFDEVDDLEESLYARDFGGHFLKMWYHLKKDITKIERIFKREALALEEFIEAKEQELGDTLSRLSVYLEKFHLYSRNCTTHLSKLESMYHYHHSLKNEKINDNLYVLAIISGIFLPLNLIVGFFGMNTDNMFFKDNPLATQYVFTLIVVLFLIFLFGPMAVRGFKNFFILRYLTKSRFYQELSKKFLS